MDDMSVSTYAQSMILHSPQPLLQLIAGLDWEPHVAQSQSIRRLPLDLLRLQPHSLDKSRLFLTRTWSHSLSELSCDLAKEVAALLDPVLTLPLWRLFLTYMPSVYLKLTEEYAAKQYGLFSREFGLRHYICMRTVEEIEQDLREERFGRVWKGI
eukprot:TRINITY_DN6105_c0_g1_i4.p1 TRINITY_DN6105_c0_g1~~TRINITY_DN6105_c0_g1_i4.p1  ORF type:complete len:155 (-),score=4.64 TRINITY_DN6105_c0_g1_i4:55-519(-)